MFKKGLSQCGKYPGHKQNQQIGSYHGDKYGRNKENKKQQDNFIKPKGVHSNLSFIMKECKASSLQYQATNKILMLAFVEKSGYHYLLNMLPQI